MGTFDLHSDIEMETELAMLEYDITHTNNDAELTDMLAEWEKIMNGLHYKCDYNEDDYNYSDL